MACVLCTGVDDALMETRKMILERAGHAVIKAKNEREIAKVCKQYSFDVAILGQAMAPTAKVLFARLRREHCPAASILELYWIDHGRVVEGADSWLAVPPETTHELAERVAKLLSDTHPTRFQR